MAVEVALALRDRGLDTEIVSCDSMGVYRGLDVVADKPSMANGGDRPPPVRRRRSGRGLQRAAIPNARRAAIDDIASRGAVPMLVGGTGLYFRSVVDELEFAPTSADVRARLEAEYPDVLYARLRERDPAIGGAARPTQRASRRARRRGHGAHRTSPQ